MIRIAIADDDPNTLRGMRKIINWEEHGYTVIGTVGSAWELFRLCEEQPVQVVITDIEMPRLNGLDMISVLRQRYPHIQAIIISAFESFSYAKQAIRYGCHNYLLKPISRSELLDTLSSLRPAVEAYTQSPPESAKEILSSFNSAQIVEKVCREMENNLSADFTLEHVSNKHFINPNYFSKIFKARTGENFSSYKLTRKIDHAKWLLKNSSLRVYEIATRVGYDDVHYFCRIFKQRAGLTPREYRNGSDNGEDSTEV
ncbi:DNA-binding response regulator [Clostridia bacterium]|nr:DNA-binding response regulator [Clostridia bacterium]